MIPTRNLDELKTRHRYASAEDKMNEKFSRTLIELAGEKIYDAARSTSGKDDMDVDPVDVERRQKPDEYEPDEYTEKEWE